MGTQNNTSAGKKGNSGDPHVISALLVADANAPHELSDDPFYEAGVQVQHAIGLDEAQLRFAETRPDLVFLPLSVAGRSTRQFLERVLSAKPRSVVVVIASNDQINTAAEAMRKGAFDCLFRPFSTQRLTKTLLTAIEMLPSSRRATSTHKVKAGSELSNHKTVRGRGAGSPSETDWLSGLSPQMHDVLAQLDAAAASDAPVFILGEDGTGKTLAAHRLHERSLNAAGPMITVDCATLTPDNFDTHVLGHEGAIARAAGGTLYLDELCDLEPRLQTRLLSLLDDETLAAGERPRIVTSTGHAPLEMIEAGRLQPELYYRLRVALISLPPLRDRRGAISEVAKAKLAEFSRLEGRAFTAIRDDAMALLEAHSWPGNMRELINSIWSAVILNDGPELTPEMLPEEIVSPASGDDDAPEDGDGFVGMTLEEIERAAIEATIRAEGGSIPRAARVLDVSPSTIYRKRSNWAKGAKD